MLPNIVEQRWSIVLPPPAPPSGDGVQRRQSTRHKVLRKALIIFQRGNCSIPCQIRDLSDTGAMLALGDAMLCPKEFFLKPDLGETRNCEVMWRKSDRIGVRFF